MQFSKKSKKLNLIDGRGGLSTARYIVGKWAEGGQSCIVNYAYYASYVLMQSDDEFLESMLVSDYILIDGIGMQLYFKFLKGIWLENLNGTDLNPVFIDVLEKQAVPYAFYGTSAEHIHECRDKINNQYPASHLYYAQDGFSPLDWSKIYYKSVLFVGLGSPRQENWIRENLKLLQEKKILVIGVGGFFDFLSGFYVRAPVWVRKLKMEWAWRTMLHPGRHYKKRIRDISIIYLPFKDRIGGYKEKINLKRLA